eukprot:11266294-Alexandrium_andersonii.AAC.1
MPGAARRFAGGRLQAYERGVANASPGRSGCPAPDRCRRRDGNCGGNAAQALLLALPKMLQPALQLL